MRLRILCAGFGGQGALLIGKLVANAGMKEGKHVTWLPSYGPEMRGGTANVSVVVSDKYVSSPIFTRIDTLVALNQPSLDKFAPDTEDAGLILANGSLCHNLPEGNGARMVSAPLSKLAEEMGSIKSMNMAALGALVELTQCVSLDTVREDLVEMLEEKNPKLLELNLEGIKRGSGWVKENA